MAKKSVKALKPKAQIAALPVRVDAFGRLSILLVTSRETHRWIIPKGWPQKRLSRAQGAAREAYEEAGVIGRIASKPMGHFNYWKRLGREFVYCRVAVYLLHVDKLSVDWPEKGQRQQAWFDVEDAADLVDEPGLKLLIRELESGVDRIAAAE